MTDSIEDYLTSLEDTFYRQGLDAGTAHGELHGLFEGRALGKEKAWELWEEVGYYQGVAVFWKGVLAASGGGSARAQANLDAVLALVAQFPLHNDSSSLRSTTTSDHEAPANGQGELDIPALLSSIRAKYRVACASLGIRPRMVAAGSAAAGEEGTQAVKLAL